MYFMLQVKLGVFLTYARAIGMPYFALYMVLYIMFMGVSIFSNTWISYWTEDQTLNNVTVLGNSALRREKNDYYFGVYGGLGAAQGKSLLLLNVSAELIWQSLPQCIISFKTLK